MLWIDQLNSDLIGLQTMCQLCKKYFRDTKLFRNSARMFFLAEHMLFLTKTPWWCFLELCYCKNVSNWRCTPLWIGTSPTVSMTQFILLENYKQNIHPSVVKKCLSQIFTFWSFSIGLPVQICRDRACVRDDVHHFELKLVFQFGWYHLFVLKNVNKKCIPPL